MKKNKKKKPDFSKPKPEKKDELEIRQIEEKKDDENSSVKKEIESRRKERSQKFFPDRIYNNLPLIVIAGRPNVGKSTLFNALTHTKRAITDPTPGVTRDPVEGTCFLSGLPVHLMDTGGYKLTRNLKSRESEMDDLVVEKTVSMFQKADKILLLLDATEINSEDEELIHLLRSYSDKLIVAVNKTEGGKNEHLAYNYMKYGFKDISLISAFHGDGLNVLQEKMIEGLDFSKVTEGSEEERPIRIAILGKPNVGKSTLSNALTHTEPELCAPGQNCKGFEVDICFRIRHTGHYDQSFQAGERSQGHCRSKIRQGICISQVPAVSGKCRVCRKFEAAGTAESASGFAANSGRTVAAAILTLWVLPRALHCVQRKAYSNENRCGSV